MYSREDFFKSPHPRGIDYANDIRFGCEGEGLFDGLFGIGRGGKSPFSFYSPNPAFTPYVQKDRFASKPEDDRESLQTENKKCEPIVPYMIDRKLDLEEKEQEDEEWNQTPCRKNIVLTSSPLLTTATKKYDLRCVNSATSKRTTRESERGLRVLSKLAYQIVLESGPTSYKEVADKLIAQQNEQQNIDEKEKQNIKRRVYDALNVLIALGQLDKKGRKIVKSKKREKKEEEENKLIQNKGKLLQRLKKKRQAVEEKRLERERINNIYKGSKKLFIRNQKEEMKNGPAKVQFPLLFTISPLDMNAGKVIFKENQSQPISIKGEFDVIPLFAPSVRL